MRRAMTNPYKNECKHLVDHDCFLDRAEVAAHYRRAEKTLANWASAGYGPPFEINPRPPSLPLVLPSNLGGATEAERGEAS